MVEEMKLPNFDKAIIEIEKLRDYCLNSKHPVGKHKALMFNTQLGLTSQDSSELKEFIAREIKNSDAIESFSDKYGKRFYVDLSLTKLSNTEIIRTLWIIRYNEIVPRFVSCYIKK